MKQFKINLGNKKGDFLRFLRYFRYAIRYTRCLLGNISAGKGINSAAEGIVKSVCGNKKVRKTATKNKKDF